MFTAMTDPSSARDLTMLDDDTLRALSVNPGATATLRDTARREIERRVAGAVPEVRAKITAVDMPFANMVQFMVKWSLAAIPAMIILFAIGAALLGVLGSLGGVFRGR